MGASWLARVLWASAIFLFSTDAFSEVGTGRFIVPVLHWLFPHASHHAIFLMHYSIRKCAHVTEYFVFSLLVLEAIRGGRPGWNRKWGIWAISIAAIYASTDEIHQLFVPSRGASVVDVMIDISGAAPGAVFHGVVDVPPRPPKRWRALGGINQEFRRFRLGLISQIRR